MNNGRADAPSNQAEAERGVLVRLSIAGEDEHGGEAESSREAFRAMLKAEREALVRFVESL